MRSRARADVSTRPGAQGAGTPVVDQCSAALVLRGLIGKSGGGVAEVGQGRDRRFGTQNSEYRGYRFPDADHAPPTAPAAASRRAHLPSGPRRKDHRIHRGYDRAGHTLPLDLRRKPPHSLMIQTPQGFCGGHYR